MTWWQWILILLVGTVCLILVACTWAAARTYTPKKVNPTMLECAAPGCGARHYYDGVKPPSGVHGTFYLSNDEPRVGEEFWACCVPHARAVLGG